MVDRNLIHSLEDEAIDSELGALFSTSADELHEMDITELYYPEGGPAEQKFELNEIVEGTIVRADDDHVVVSKAKAPFPATSGTKTIHQKSARPSRS